MLIAINTIKMKGKTKSQFTKKGRFEGKTPTFKKAIVTLKEGQTIDLFGEVIEIMAIRKLKPNTPGTRFMSVSTFEEVTKTTPEKSLTAPLFKSAGRNNKGRITSRHRGGGHKRKYRIIDFKRNKDGIPAKVFSIEYDPNRSARIALLHYADGEKRYILAPNTLKVG